MELPKEQEKREQLKNAIESAVSIKLKADGIKLEMKEVQEAVKEDLDMSVREFNKRVNVRYMQLKAAQKYQAEKESAGVEFAENEILFGGSV